MTTTRADHAELARLAEAAICCEDANYPAIRGDFGKAANPATVLALLSEIATLRARHETTLAGECPCCVLTRAECADAIAEIEIGRTQAERQRDEAVGLLREWHPATREAYRDHSLEARTEAFLANQGTDHAD